jgi:hypothetical protein
MPQYLDYLASNVTIEYELCIRNHIEGSGRGQIEVLSRYLPSGIVKNYEKHVDG